MNFETNTYHIFPSDTYTYTCIYIYSPAAGRSKLWYVVAVFSLKRESSSLWVDTTIMECSDNSICGAKSMLKSEKELQLQFVQSCGIWFVFCIFKTDVRFYVSFSLISWRMEYPCSQFNLTVVINLNALLSFVIKANLVVH